MTDNGVRPLHFVRVRLYRGGMAEWVQQVLRDEQAALYEDLAKLRAEGKPESHPEVTKVRENLVHSVNALRDIDSALISLVGPDEDPRT